MGTITALRAAGGRGKQVKVFLDGKFAFKLENELVVEEGLEIKQALPAERIKAIVTANSFKRCYNAAALLLSYRPRSEPELRKRLQQRGFNGSIIDAVMTRLKKQGLVDDTAFARFWKDNRESFSPRSQWLTRLELKQKGVADDVIDQVVASIDDEDSAYRSAQKKARSLPRADYQSFRRRLGEHLRRRGFGYGVIKSAINRVWQNQSNDPD